MSMTQFDASTRLLVGLSARLQEQLDAAKENEQLKVSVVCVLLAFLLYCG